MAGESVRNQSATVTGVEPARRSVFGRGLLVPLSILLVALIGNVTFAPRQEGWVFADNEFATSHQLLTDRAEPYRSWGLMWYPERIGAKNFMCVPEGSRHHRILGAPWNLRNSEVTSDCEPLDFTDRAADRLHPNLITEDIDGMRVLYAYDPSYSPVGDWAILVRAEGDVDVMIHVDTLRHLGLADIQVPR